MIQANLSWSFCLCCIIKNFKKFSFERRQFAQMFEIWIYVCNGGKEYINHVYQLWSRSWWSRLSDLIFISLRQDAQDQQPHILRDDSWIMHACASSALFECMAKNPIRTRARSYALPAAFEPGVMMKMMISRHRFPHAAEMSRTHILITETAQLQTLISYTKIVFTPFFPIFLLFLEKCPALLLTSDLELANKVVFMS